MDIIEELQQEVLERVGKFENFQHVISLVFEELEKNSHCLETINPYSDSSVIISFNNNNNNNNFTKVNRSTDVIKVFHEYVSLKQNVKNLKVCIARDIQECSQENNIKNFQQRELNRLIHDLNKTKRRFPKHIQRFLQACDEGNTLKIYTEEWADKVEKHLIILSD